MKINLIEFIIIIQFGHRSLIFNYSADDIVYWYSNFFE